MMCRFIKTLLVIMIMICLSSCGGEKEVDLNKYIKVSFDGINGSGKPVYTVDWKEINELIGQSQISNALKKLNPPAYAELVNAGVQPSCSDLLAVYPDRIDNLTNGDVVTFVSETGTLANSASLTEVENALKTKIIPASVKVENLPDAILIDVFQAFDENSVKFYCTVPGDTSSIKGIADINITDANRIIYEGNGFLVQYEDEIPSLDPMFSVSKNGEILGYFSFCGTHYFVTGYKEGDLWPVYITEEDISILNGYGFSLERKQMDYVVKDIADSESITHHLEPDDS